MLSKMLLVAILIVLTWSSIQLSKNNESLQTQFVELTANNELINEQLLSNQKLLQEQNKAIEKKAKLPDVNKSILSKLTKLEKSVSSLTSLKGSIDKTKASVDKQSKSLAENKKTTAEIKKSLSDLIAIVKRQSINLAKHSHSLTSSKVSKVTSSVTPKKQAYKETKVTKLTKPSVVKESKDSVSLNRVFFELYKTEEFHKKKEMKKALEHLAKLKTQLWKSRNKENISKELVMSILSSIDITKNKWSNKDTNYGLEKIELKLNRLICKPGVCK